MRPSVPSQSQRSRSSQTVLRGGKSFGSAFHWHPVQSTSKMAFRTSRTSTVRGRPPRLAGRINGATSNHSASVRSLSYRRPRRSAAARWSGFHMRHLSPTQVPHKESQPIPETQLLSGWALSRAPSTLLAGRERERIGSASVLGRHLYPTEPPAVVGFV